MGKTYDMHARTVGVLAVATLLSAMATDSFCSWDFGGWHAVKLVLVLASGLSTLGLFAMTLVSAGIWIGERSWP